MPTARVDQLRSPATTCTLALMVGAIAATVGISRRIAAPSSSLIEPSEPCAFRAPPIDEPAGTTISRLAPSVESDFCIRSWAPAPSALVVTTEAMPMRMPSAVSDARSLARPSARSASPMAIHQPRTTIAKESAGGVRRPSPARDWSWASVWWLLARRGAATCSSETIRPSRTVTTRVAQAATSGSWVTMTIVSPWSRLSH